MARASSASTENKRHQAAARSFHNPQAGIFVTVVTKPTDP